MAKEYDYLVWREEGVWTAHSPSIPGVFGLGDTKKEAEEDFFEALALMASYLDEIGEPMPKRRRITVGVVEVT
jgi:predicted RNase H-like HicB family nuclease